MRTLTLAHVSDLHLGVPGAERATASVCESLVEAGVDHVMVTGDVTQRGRTREWEQFQRAFAPLLEAGRVTLVPGNHDRADEDVASIIMPDQRVQVAEHEGLFMVRVDSTAPHNRSLLTAHGHLDEQDMAAVVRALDAAPPRALVVVALHHHVHPLPGDFFHEDLVSWLGWPWCDELSGGQRLLRRILGRCDLLLHGHRHVPRERHEVANGSRPIGVYNAGSSSKLGCVRVFRHARGLLEGAPQWLAARPVAPHAPQEIASAA